MMCLAESASDWSAYGKMFECGFSNVADRTRLEYGFSNAADRMCLLELGYSNVRARGTSNQCRNQ